MHVTAHVEHHQGNTVVSASTKEWAIKQHLRSNLDVAAMAAIGRILAHRCLECGLLEIHSDYDKEKSSSKVSVAEKLNVLYNLIVFLHLLDLCLTAKHRRLWRGP